MNKEGDEKYEEPHQWLHGATIGGIVGGALGHGGFEASRGALGHGPTLCKPHASSAFDAHMQQLKSVKL
jgi:hypothetical protein